MLNTLLNRLQGLLNGSSASAPATAFSYTYPVPPAGGRRFVVPDIHGCAFTFSTLLSRINLKTSDQLFLLGDYIDRGPNSTGVIDMIIALKERGYAVFPLRGNHEQMLLEEMEEYPGLFEDHIDMENLDAMLDEEGNMLPRYRDFLQHLPYYFELKDCFLVHGGFNFNVANPFEDVYNMLWIRDFENNFEITKNKRIIHGHTPCRFFVIEEQVRSGADIISLDNGCVFGPAHEGLGNLLCLNLDTLELIVQPNVER